MSEVDAFDGEHARKSLACNPASYENDNLLLVTPEVDGRLKDEGSPSTWTNKASCWKTGWYITQTTNELVNNSV